MKHYNINEMFSTAKDSLDIRKCAEYYGMTIDRGGRAICPFHDDRHPSLSFKDGYFKCFACGEGGDVFKLVGRLTGIDKPIDVLRLLNRDFGLNLPLDEKISHEQAKLIREKAKEREHYKDLDKRFEEWTDRAFIACSRYTKLLRQWREEFAPSSPNEELNPLFEESLIRLDYMEYLTAELITADRKKMREIYMLNRKEIKWIERRIECYE